MNSSSLLLQSAAIASTLALVGLTFADEPSVVTIDHLPQTTDEFVELRNKVATTPEGGAALFVVALLVLTDDSELGEQLITIALDRNNLQASGQGYQGFRPHGSQQYHLKRVKERPHLPLSYVAGTKAADGYKAALPYQFSFSTNRFSKQAEDRVKIFIASSGADTPRPLTMKRNDKGIWKVLEWSSLSVGVRQPGPKPSDDL